MMALTGATEHRPFLSDVIERNTWAARTNVVTKIWATCSPSLRSPWTTPSKMNGRNAGRQPYKKVSRTAGGDAARHFAGNGFRKLLDSGEDFSKPLTSVPTDCSPGAMPRQTSFAALANVCSPLPSSRSNKVRKLDDYHHALRPHLPRVMSPDKLRGQNVNLLDVWRFRQ